MKKILLFTFLLTINPIFAMNEISSQSKASSEEESVTIYPKKILDAHIDWVNGNEITIETKTVCYSRRGGELDVNYIRVPRELKAEYDKFFETFTLDKNEIHAIPAKSIPPSIKNIFVKYAWISYCKSNHVCAPK